MARFFFAAFFCACFYVPLQTHAQQALGIDWEVPEQSSDAVAELQSFSKLGVSHLQVHQSLNDETWRVINELGFSVYGLLPIKFPTALTFTNTDSTFRQHINDLFDHYNSQQAVQAIGLLSYGNWTNQSFQRAATQFAEESISDTDKPIYYVTADPSVTPRDSLFSFRLINLPESNSASTGNTHFIYHPHVSGRLNLEPVKNVLNHISSIPNSVIFLNSGWLQEILDHYPDLESTIRLYATSDEPAFPLPQNASVTNTDLNLIVIMLFVAWIILAVVYNFNPVYRRSFIRYYSGHNFYVNDVMRRHIRSMFAASTILIQHAIAGGIVMYCMFNTGFSALGLQALQYHYPILAPFSETGFAIFLMGVLFTLFTEGLMIIWLWLACIKSTYLSQIVNLYPWALQFNLILATVSLGLYLAGVNFLLIYITGILFAVIFLTSFIMTAIDLGRHITSQRIWFYTGSLGIYTMVLAGFIIWLATSQAIKQVVELAINL